MKILYLKFMHNDDFLKKNLVQSFRAFRKLYAGELSKINLKLALGYASFLLPVLAIGVFFYLHRDADSIPASSQYVFFPVLFISLFFPGLFYLLFKDELLKRKRAIFNIYHQYGEGALETVLSGAPFVLYARGFGQERDLGNKRLSNSWDEKFSLSSNLEEEMDKRTNFSFFPQSLSSLLDENGFSIVALGHSGLKRGLASVRLLFCRDAVWEETFQELARRASLIVLNTLERNGDYWLKPGQGVEWEMELLLNDNTLAGKTFVLYNEFERPPASGSRLSRIIGTARWASPFTLHDPGTQQYRRPEGEIPEGLRAWIKGQT